MREVSKQFTGTVDLVVVNMYTERGKQQADALHAHGHPVLLFHDRHGKELLRRYGVIDQEVIQHGFRMLVDTP